MPNSSPNQSTSTPLTIANRLSIARLLAVPLFILVMVYYRAGLREHQPREMLRWLGAFLFLASCLTDALDGYLARSRGECTRLGAVLDPLADKALLLSGLVLLSLPTGGIPLSPRIPTWYVWLVISRDVLLIAGFALIHEMVGQVEVRPSWSGKLGTVLQMLIIVKVLFQLPGPGFDVLLAVASLCVLVSTFEYTMAGVRQLAPAAGVNRHDKEPGT